MKSILALLFAFSVGTLCAQSDFDERLLAKFSEEQITELQKNKPQTLDYWTYYLDKGYKIESVDNIKSHLLQTSVKIKSKQLKNNEINLFDLDLSHPLDTYAFFKIEKTDKVLVLIPRNQIVESFNASNQKK